MAVGVLDIVGNNYGGTSYNQSGVGDRVQDRNGVLGTVTAMMLDPLGNSQHRCVVLTDVLADGNRHEVPAADCQALTIISHADGTGLVSGGGQGPAVSNNPPTEGHILNNPVKVG
jgi:hypothetical protein